MSDNRVAILSVNKLDDPSTFHVNPSPPIQHKNSENKYEINKRNQQKYRCQFCHATFSSEANSRGSCLAAPDKISTYIEAVTCVCCMDAIVYHCLSDSENEFHEFSNPCSCNGVEKSDFKKWSFFSVMSICVPCLLFYWPLKGCHKAAIACGWCGGKHKASRSDTVRDII